MNLHDQFTGHYGVGSGNEAPARSRTPRKISYKRLNQSGRGDLYPLPLNLAAVRAKWLIFCGAAKSGG